MKRKSYFVSGLIVLLAFVGTACKDSFLNRPPDDAISVDGFYSSEQQVNQGTAPLYNTPWFDLNDKALWAIGDITSGNLNTFDPAVVNFKNFQVTGDNTRIIESWRSLFNVISQSNFIINNLPAKVAPSVDAAITNRAVGEARFMRALAYFYLVRLWGPVPIIESTTELIANAQVPRHRTEDVYKFILNDLQFAEANCPKRSGWAGANQARVTQGAAQALMAKVYLNLRDYAKAREKAEAVINSGEYELMAEYADIFKTKNNVNSPTTANRETIFAFVWTVDQEGWGVQNTNQAYFAPFGEGLTGSWDGWGSAVPTLDILQAYEPGDKRLRATFMTPGSFYPELKSTKGGYTYPADQP
ncbi:MAG: RagB/SusD family nutrient uptake outer membrane protein, partial [Cytophagales bacterium]|nr:RagB/SusD family nutrient uptake outer membrane protein [Cytophagales bacterium]